MKLCGFNRNAVSLYTNDCTVRALASVTEIDYFVLFEALALLGRRPNSGWDIDGFVAEHKGECLRHKFTYAKLTNRGRFLLWNRTHAWAICDGVLHDKSQRNMRYTHCFEVTGATLPDATESLLKRAEALAKAKYDD